MSTTVGHPVGTVQEIELGDELSIFDSATGKAISLNRTARDVWALADGVSDAAEVTSILARAYGVKPEAITADVLTTLDDLTSAGLLVRRSP